MRPTSQGESRARGHTKIIGRLHSARRNSRRHLTMPIDTVRILRNIPRIGVAWNPPCEMVVVFLWRDREVIVAHIGMGFIGGAGDSDAVIIPGRKVFWDAPVTRPFTTESLSGPAGDGGMQDVAFEKFDPYIWTRIAGKVPCNFLERSCLPFLSVVGGSEVQAWPDEIGRDVLVGTHGSPACHSQRGGASCPASESRFHVRDGP